MTHVFLADFWLLSFRRGQLRFVMIRFTIFRDYFKLLLMFSYSRAIQSLVISEVYNRGVKLYLEGKVVSFKNLSIDSWREYKVLDKDTNLVKVPLFHLALNREKYHLIDKAIAESASCSCDYFREFGTCRHLVAVFQALEKEFFSVKGLSEEKSKSEESILDNIFAVEKENRIRKLQSLLDAYFLKPLQANLHWWEKFLFENRSEPTEFESFRVYLEKFLANKLRDYDNEKKVLHLISISLQLDGVNWFGFWVELLPNFSQKNQLTFWSELWKLRKRALTQAFDELIDNCVSSLEESQKLEIFERLKADYETNFNLWLDFVLSAKLTIFLENNLDNFDPELLLQIIEILPEQREQIEIKIMNKTKVWSDFLPAGDYEELMKLLENWAIVGRSDFFDETVKYIKVQHKKKPKLMAFLRKLGY
jgi:hypothetical protein